MNRPVSKTNSAIHRFISLVIGDLLAMFIIVWIGRLSHAMSAFDLAGGLFTAAPFIAAWFLITPWFGLFRDDISFNWRKVAPRLLLAWCMIGLPLALVLRTLLLGRPILEGIIPIFALVMLGTTTPAMLLWRLVYAWWMNRQLTDDLTGLKS